MPNKGSATVLWTVEGRENGPGIATVTLDRPPLNILDLELIAGLHAAAEELAMRDDVQLIVLRGAGPKAFSAGVAIEIHTPDRIPEMIERFHGALRAWWALEPLTVAAVHGHCLGGGMELAAVCDLVVADRRARFGQPEIRVGCYPPVAAALYPALLGPGRTLDLISTGRTLDAIEAERIGFVTRLTEVSESDAATSEEVTELDRALAQLSEEILSHSAVAQRLGKKAVRASLGDRFERALAASEQIYLDEMASTRDVDEGARAFLEKRPAVWKHR